MGREDTQRFYTGQTIRQHRLSVLKRFRYSMTATPVTMAAKSHIRNASPLIIAPSTNDGLAAAAKNIGALLNLKSVFFVPFGQDDAEKKPRSLSVDFEKIPEAVAAALNGVQLQPILV